MDEYIEAMIMNYRNYTRKVGRFTVGRKIESSQNGCDKVYELEPDERECYRCGTCAYFKVNADMPNVESTCKRIDHKNFVDPWFKKTYVVTNFLERICSDFIPAYWCIAAKKELGTDLKTTGKVIKK